MSLNKLYCINLADNINRWERFEQHISKFKKNYSVDIERIEAVDARKSHQTCLNHMGLHFSPFTISIGLYFYCSPAAFGCSLSHYKIWQKMVTEKIPYAIIVEDDISINSLVKFLETKDTKYQTVDLIQLTQRAVKRDNYTFFHGSESYILSLSGAQKLLEATKDPSLFKDITNYEESLSVYKYYSNKNIPIPKSDVTKMPSNTIVAPSDQIFSLCTHPNCHDKARLTFEVNSSVSLDYNHSKFTNISPAIQAWKANERVVEEYVNYLQTTSYYFN